MRRHTLICVSFAVALHGAAFLALDRFWFLAATHRPPIDRDLVIELVPVVPDPVAVPVATAAAFPPAQLAPALEPKKQPEPKSETKLEPKLEPKPESKSQLLVQTEPVPLGPKPASMVAPVTTVASSDPLPSPRQ